MYPVGTTLMFADFMRFMASSFSFLATAKLMVAFLMEYPVKKALTGLLKAP